MFGPGIVQLDPQEPDPPLPSFPAFLLVQRGGVPLAYRLCGDAAGWERALRDARRESGNRLLQRCLEEALRQPCPESGYLLEGWECVRTAHSPDGPSVTIAVCTTGERASLAAALKSIASNAAGAELMVVVNGAIAPRLKSTIARVAPAARVVEERRPGLDMARNCAVSQARTELVAFIDDDAQVAANWLSSVRSAFAGNPAIQALTGLILPAELATPSQAWFEAYGGFGRGCASRWWQSELAMTHSKSGYLMTSQVGSGTNMVFRNQALKRLGGFHPALDVGTPTGGAGDLEIFSRILRMGWELLYEPRAVVLHHHRRSFEEVREQVAGFGSFMSMLLEIARCDGAQRLNVLKLTPALLSYFYWRVREGLFEQDKWWRRLVRAELSGYARALTGGPLRRALAAATVSDRSADSPRIPNMLPNYECTENNVIVEIRNGIPPLSLLLAGFVTIDIRRSGRPIGRCRLYSPVPMVSAHQLRAAVSTAVGRQLVDPASDIFSSDTDSRSYG